MKLGSLFDGIGGWLIAAQKFNVTPIWASEIESFPIAVTKKHFPNVKHLGDVRQIDGASIEPVDIITMGSPCQNFSIAGNHAGLKGKESSLFYEGIRVVKEMRRVTGGKFPRCLIFENVPNTLGSNKGNDFRIMLEEITEAVIPMPHSGRWAKAGMVRVGGCSVVWRLLDAQYFGVAQRRKRLFLTASFGNGSAEEILFEREGVQRDSSESRKTQEKTTTKTESNIGNTVYGVGIENNIAGTLDASYYKGAGCRGNVERTALAYTQQAFGQYKETGKASAIKARDYKDATDLCVQEKVRRLTPTECERLQGLPDGYTFIDDRGCSDTARYKALGNGMAQPCADYIMEKVVLGLKKE